MKLIGKAEKLDYTYLSNFLKLKDLNIIPIYFSTDAVFDGSKGNYKESDILIRISMEK